MITRRAIAQLIPALGFALALVFAGALSSCARQFDIAEESGESTIFRPFGKMRAKAQAEEFLRAYLHEGRKNIPFQRITRKTEPPEGPVWIVHYSGKDIHTGVFVEIQEGTGRGRIRGFLGNVLVSDNPTAGPAGATNEFRTLEDFRQRLAQQEARFKRGR